MSMMRRLAAGAAFTALTLTASAAYCQEISGGISGTVTGASGAPVANAQVEVTYEPTGTTNSTTTSSSGFFTVRNLPVGGPYTVKVSAAGQAAKTARIDGIGLGAPYQLDISLEANEVSEVVVTGAQNKLNQRVETGPRSSFTATDIALQPSFGGDLKDLAKSNAFVTIDPANSNAMIIAGANNHTNTIYVDGVRQSDDFGLNNSGYPTQRSPFAIDWVQAFNVEVAPYDVQYGNFQGGILNVVTKSGSNTFHGAAFYETDSSHNSGNHIGRQAQLSAFNADRLVTTRFHDESRGFNISGPIIPDRLFFFFGYAKYTGIGTAGNFVPSDVAGANPVPSVTQADVNNVTNLIKTGYGYDPLSFGGSGPVIDTKYFGKFDWYITENHHAFLSYQQTDGTTYNVPNGSVANRRLNLASNDYLFEQILKAWTFDLVSHWTDNFSTDLEYSHKDVQSPTVLQTGPFAEFIVQLPSGGSIYAGPDISRQANNLGNVDQQWKVHANYTAGNHVLTVGYEHEKLDEFDLFVQNATGVYTFNSNCGYKDPLLNLQNHIACSFTYQNAFDNNPLTAAATITNNTDVLFVQDEWRPMANLTLRAGLRYERFSTSDVPRLNTRFQTQYGFPNTATIDGKSILMPRFGFNWKPDPTLTISGGFGLFSGGNPGVYTYNSYQNTGNILGTKTYTCNNSVVTIPSNCQVQLQNVTGSTIPTSAQTDITNSANLGTGNANALDPNFKPASVWKASLSAQKILNFSDYDWMKGLGTLLGDGWRLHADFLYAKDKDGIGFIDLWELQNVLATPAPDGRPVYNPARYANALGRNSGSDIELTNTHGGNAKIFAIGFGRSWDFGLDFDYTYTTQRVQDVNPATSSVATSNYNNNTTFDPNFPTLSTSNYQIRYSHKLSVGYSHAFFGDFKTSIKLFASARAGLPFSYAFCTEASSSCISPTFSGPAENLFGQFSTTTNHQLLYVPQTDAGGNVTATSDPKVTYAAGFDLNAFNQFLRESGLVKYAGRVSPRNAFRSRDVAQVDLRLSQELPAWFPSGAKGEIFLDIINLGNLLNKNWGIDNQVSFPYNLGVVAAKNCQFSGQPVPGVTPATTYPACAAGPGNFYQFDAFKPQNTTSTIQIPSSPPVPTWVLKVGIRYKF